jgi:GT2 family glycosyltransferase
MQDELVGLVGASQLPPVNSSWKQRWIGYDLAKAKFPVQKAVVDTEMATHAGMACRRLVWEKMGGESDHLVTGTDTDLRERLREAGYRVIVAPETWVYHPLPASFRIVLRSAIYNGRHQVEYRKVHGFQKGFLKPFKEISNGVDLWTVVAREVMIFLPNIFISKRFPIIGFRPLNALFRLSMVVTYSFTAYKKTAAQIKR